MSCTLILISTIINIMTLFLQIKRGKRSLNTQKHRRKLFRKRKKKERWEKMLEEAVAECWRERARMYHAAAKRKFKGNWKLMNNFGLKKKPKLH